MSEYLIVSYSEAVAMVGAGNVDRPTLALSFDDGTIGQAAAARLLSELGVSACFFVCSGLVGLGGAAAEKACSARLGIGPTAFLGWDHLHEMRALGHEIGCHSHSHPALSRLHGAELEAEVDGAAAALASRLGPARHYAWPFGRFVHFSPEARARVFACGLVSCASAERGVHRSRGGRAMSPRSVCLRREVVEAWEPSERVIGRLRARAAIARAAAVIGRSDDGWPRSWPPL